MDCIKCGGNAKVRESVHYESIIFRRRKCVECGEVFYTEESTEIRHPELREVFWKLKRWGEA